MKKALLFLFGLGAAVAQGADFRPVDLAPLKAANAFADAVWKDDLGKTNAFVFGGVPFRLMSVADTADPSFRLDLGPGDFAEADLLFCIDEANASALPFVTLRLTAGGVAGDVALDLRAPVDADAVAPEVGRILRGPSGTLHFPVRFARVPLHPDAVAAAQAGAKDVTLELLAPKGAPCAFTVAALTLVTRPPRVPCADGVTLSFDLDLTRLPPLDEPVALYAAEGALEVVLRDARRTPCADGSDVRGGNYLNFTLADGSCPVVEATLPGPAGRVGIPLGALKTPLGRHRVRIVRNNAYFTLDVDERRDEDFPYVPLLWPRGDRGVVKSPLVGGFAFAFGAPKGVVPRAAAFEKGFAAQYWTPSDHNRWVGDVVVANWDGRLHVFYLVDRRHHNSKGGRGGHWFEHIVSDDLVSWTELPTAVGMDVPTEYVGTGTPFRWNGKYCLAYGLHTTRHAEGWEGLPVGGTYATSDDGVRFTKTHKMITDDQNPSVYNRADGAFGMGCVDTLRKSASLDGPWEVAVSNAHVFGDCPCPFEWNGWHYVIQGFCTMAMSPTGANGTYSDEVLAGYDVYEGLSVPMVAPWKGGRRLLVGWINHGYGWGGWLCFRELVQYPDGHLGTKWVPEMPLPVRPTTYRAKPGETLTVAFEPADGAGRAFAFVLDAARGKARFVEKGADGAYPDVPTLKDLAEKAEAKFGAKRIFAGRKFRPDDAGDFAIGNIRGLDRPFEVKVVNHFDRKAGLTLVDVEIAGQRTMVTRRFGSYKETKAK